MWMTNELLPKFGVFLSKFGWSLLPSKLEGSHEVILGDFPFLMEQATWTLSFFSPNPYDQVVHNRHLNLKETHTHAHTHQQQQQQQPKLGIVCERYRLSTLAPTFQRHMELPPKTSNAHPTKKSYMLGVWDFKCCSNPHDSGNHPTTIETFHPRRLPPSGLQTW